MSVDHPTSHELGQEDLKARIRGLEVDQAELARRYGHQGRRPADALPADRIRRQMEELVFMVLSMRRSVAPAAEALAWFPGPRVEAMLGHIRQVCRSSLDLGYHLCTFAPEVLLHLHDDEIGAWIADLLDLYDHKGSQGCIRAMRRVADDALAIRGRRSGVAFADVAPVLESFTTGLAGRRLRLATDDASYTDSEVIHLPALLSRFAERGDNFRLYKATIAHLWAQTWFGTWRMDDGGLWLDRIAAEHRLTVLYQSAEGLRLDACVARELPGLWREMSMLEAPPRLPPAWAEPAAALRSPDADVALSRRIAADMAAAGNAPVPGAAWHGELRPRAVADAVAARIARERSAFQHQLAVIADELGGNLRGPETGGLPPTVQQQPDDDWPGGVAFQLVLGDHAIQPQAEARQLMHSIVQDFGHIPEEYLQAAGQGLYHRKAGAARDDGAPDQAGDTFVYDEWDHTRRAYRKGWCQLREGDVHPADSAFVADTRRKYRGLLKQLYRTFEALRGEERMLRRQPFGEDPDIDALVAAYGDQARGLEMDDRLFRHRQRVERDVAVLFMVDMSGSTKGWINDVQRESLVLLCEALERLGDRYAIYGFSGFTHMRCELYCIKGFAQPYDSDVHARIAGIQPRDYTRMGVTIRHLTRKLLEVEARTRVLITLSDGRPDDEDGYRGDYGIEDTRQAVLEARNQGVHPFCITIDDEAQDYLPHMFGAASWTLVAQVAKLPYRVSDIYRRITV